MQHFPRLYPIVSTDSARSALPQARKLIGAGAGILQLRMKLMTDAELCSLTVDVIRFRDSIASRCKIIVNDRADVAFEAAADGVHLGQEDALGADMDWSPLARARALLGPESVIGLSTHSTKQLEDAPEHLVDYLAVGPVFTSKSKSGHAEPLGIEAVSEAASITSLPLVAIGGISVEKVPDLIAAGADSCAMIKAFSEPDGDTEARIMVGSQRRMPLQALFAELR